MQQRSTGLELGIPRAASSLILYRGFIMVIVEYIPKPYSRHYGLYVRPVSCRLCKPIFNREPESLQNGGVGSMSTVSCELMHCTEV